MAITKIKVENLTVFEEMEMDIDANVNVIIGENGTGKTQLLKYMHELLIFTKKQEIASGITIHVTPDFFLPDKDQKRDKDKSIKIELSLDNSNEILYIVEESAKIVAIPHENVILIPTKDMLTHSKGLLAMKEKYGKNMPFDKFQIGIVSKANQWNLAEIPDFAKGMIEELEDIMDGVVVIENEEFFILKTNGQMIPFEMEAEGIKKFGLIWQLLMNDNIREGTILLWDEPEANINPKLIPTLAKIILELGRNDVQIFLATHDYFLSKYIEVLSNDEDKLAFHALYKTNNGVKCETDTKFSFLDENAIIDEKIKLYEAEVDKVMEDE